MYDPCIGSFDYQNEVALLPFIEQNNNVLAFNQSFMEYLQKQDQACGYAAYREQYLQWPPSGQQPPLYLNFSDTNCTLWEDVYDMAYATNPCFNVYEIGLQCPLLSDPLGYPTDLQYSYPGLPVYFNRTDVKKAMHAPMDVEWIECAPYAVFVGNGGPEDEDDTSPDPIQGVLPRVIEATNRVLM